MQPINDLTSTESGRSLPLVLLFYTKTNRHFYVDTLATPPKSVWVHPLEILAQHVAQQHGGDDSDDDDDAHPEQPTAPHGPPPLPPRDSNRHSPVSYPADVKHPPEEEHHDYSASSPGPSSSALPNVMVSGNIRFGKKKRRGLFGRIKDGVIGTKEERRAARAQREARRREEERIYIERRNAMMIERQKQIEAEREAYRQAAGQYPPSGYYGAGYGAPNPNAYGGPAYNPQYGYGGSYDPYYNRRGGGGGGLGLPLLGGLVGGLLLGTVP